MPGEIQVGTLSASARLASRFSPTSASPSSSAAARPKRPVLVTAISVMSPTSRPAPRTLGDAARTSASRAASSSCRGTRSLEEIGISSRHLFEHDRATPSGSDIKVFAALDVRRRNADASEPSPQPGTLSGLGASATAVPGPYRRYLAPRPARLGLAGQYLAGLAVRGRSGSRRFGRHRRAERAP